MRRAVLAVAAVLLLLLAGCDGGSSDDPEADPSTSAEAATTSADPGPVVECPRDTQEIDPALPDAVPAGATSVRLCDGGAGKVAPPGEALTTDVASVVDAVNAQPLARGGCADLRVPEFQLAFGYPDGARFVVAGRFSGCAELLVGSERRAKARPPLRTFVESLRTQLLDGTPPGPGVTAEELDCSQPAPAVAVFPPTDLAVAALCFGVVDRPADAVRVPIEDEELTTLVRSMQADTSSSQGSLDCAVFARKEYWIVGATAWGDPVTAQRGCFGLVVEGYEEWVPRGEALRIVRRLVAGAR